MESVFMDAICGWNNSLTGKMSKKLKSSLLLMLLLVLTLQGDTTSFINIYTRQTDQLNSIKTTFKAIATKDNVTDADADKLKAVMNLVCPIAIQFAATVAQRTQITLSSFDKLKVLLKENQVRRRITGFYDRITIRLNTHDGTSLSSDDEVAKVCGNPQAALPAVAADSSQIADPSAAVVSNPPDYYIDIYVKQSVNLTVYDSIVLSFVQLNGNQIISDAQAQELRGIMTDISTIWTKFNATLAIRHQDSALSGKQRMSVFIKQVRNIRMIKPTVSSIVKLLNSYGNTSYADWEWAKLLLDQPFVLPWNVNKTTLPLPSSGPVDNSTLAASSTDSPLATAPSVPVPSVAAQNVSAQNVSAQNGTTPSVVSPDSTASNATVSNITDSNGIAGNATGSNVTAGNATGSNETAPNTTAPNVTAPNTAAPNVTAPNTTAPNVTAPNTTASNVTAPNTTAPNATASNATASNATAATSDGTGLQTSTPQVAASSVTAQSSSASNTSASISNSSSPTSTLGAFPVFNAALNASSKVEKASVPAPSSSANTSGGPVPIAVNSSSPVSLPRVASTNQDTSLGPKVSGFLFNISTVGKMASEMFSNLTQKSVERNITDAFSNIVNPVIDMVKNKVHSNTTAPPVTTDTAVLSLKSVAPGLTKSGYISSFALSVCIVLLAAL